MASTARRKRQSKKEKKKMFSEKGKKGAQTRGLGLFSRQKLPALWTTEECETASRKRKVIVSPGKTRYPNPQKAKETLKKRNLTSQISSETSQIEGEQSDLESHAKGMNSPFKNEALKIEPSLFVCETSQLMKLVDDINRTSKCATENCNGILVPVKIDETVLH
ncbi:hypothetical protein ACROYT_G018639 [Oculina patagonica]